MKGKKYMVLAEQKTMIPGLTGRHLNGPRSAKTDDPCIER
jgi:hypothetical protein